MPGTLLVNGPVWGSADYFADFDTITSDPNWMMGPFNFIHLWVSGGGTLDLSQSLQAGGSVFDVSIFSDSAGVALTVSTGAGNERFSGNTGTDVFRGGDGADQFASSLGNDRLLGEGGDDTAIFNNDGTNVFDGGSGSDTVILNGGATYRFVGDASAFSVIASTGQVFHVRNVESILDYSSSSPAALSTSTLTFEAGVTVQGTAGNDVITNFSAPAGQDVATFGDDVLLGGAGNDDVRGLMGDDRIAGGTGADVLTGGRGADAFVFDAAGWTRPDADRILDFRSVDDAIWLDDAVFASLTFQPNGSLDPGQFVVGMKALDADDHLIYDSASGRLWYDADGSGRANAKVLVAGFGGGTTLAVDDFVLV